MLWGIPKFLAFNSIEANQTFGVDSKQINKRMKTNTLYIIGVDEKCKWNKNKVQVKNFQSIGKGLLEFKFPKLNFTKYEKDTIFVVSSKKDITSIKFVEKLEALGFKNLRYLKNGNKSWNEILINFRGIKLFSMFNN